MSETVHIAAEYADIEIWSGHTNRNDPGTVSIDIACHYGHVDGIPGQASAHLTAEQARQLAIALLNAADAVDPTATIATAVDVTFDGSNITITPAPGANPGARSQ